MKNSQLKSILELMKKFDVTCYEQDSLKITMAHTPKHQVDLKAKDLSLPIKTKEQEAEELLFHSATR